MSHPTRDHDSICVGFGVVFWMSVSLLVVVSGCTSRAELEWKEEDGYRWAEIAPGFFGSTGFVQLDADRTGIHFRNDLSLAEIDKNRHYLNGSGVAAGDVNGDGLVDLYFAGLTSSNRLYANVGDMQFSDVTEEAGVAHDDRYSTGAVFADINGDGHLDLLVASLHNGVSLYLNEGNGRFRLDRSSGLDTSGASTTMTLADINDDEYLDLYVANYKERSVKDIYTTRELAWENIINEPLVDPTDTYTLTPPFDQHYTIATQDGKFSGIYEVGERDAVYLNKEGSFERVNDTDTLFLNEEGKPLGLQPDWGLSAKFHDLNDDGLTDLYVCNDFETPDRVWLNQGGGTFRAMPWYAIRNFSFSCMAVDVSDIDRDGRLDIFTTEMLSPDHNRRLRQVGASDPGVIQVGDIKSRPMNNRNSMYLQREDGTYAEIAHLSGLEATGWSWATKFMDVDLDGYEDLIVATGYSYDIMDIDAQVEMVRARRNMDEHFVEFLRKTKPLELPNRILRNNGDLTFTDMTSEWGMAEEDVSHGMAFADLDNDGAQDIVLNRMNREAAIYRNSTNAPRIAVRLKGHAPNTQAVGAKVELSGGPVSQEKEVSAGGDYTSDSDGMLMFAARPDNENHVLTIAWPDGAQSRIDSVRSNAIYEISEPENRSSNTFVDRRGPMTDARPMFEDVSASIDHTHYEAPFDDFQRYPLMPVKLSQLGPGVAWVDYNQTGYDDLFIPSGKGGQLSILENDGSTRGAFDRVHLPNMHEEAVGDQTAVLGWQEDGHTRVVVGTSHYETDTLDASLAYTYTINQQGGIERSDTLRVQSAIGSMAAADIDGNGYLDLFVAGRAKPGRYPENADSKLFANAGEAFTVDARNSRLFSGIGNITGATFSDFNGDGYQDLLISPEWGHLRLFENRRGVFTEVTEHVALNQHSGWWNGVATGDFTNDGLTDIVATNMGLNSPWQMHNDLPLRMYYDDFNRDGRVDVIEAYAIENKSYVPRRAMYEYREARVVLNRMGSHDEFANATLEDILGRRLATTPYKEVNTLGHMLFVNTGQGTFEARPLPLEAQFSTAFGATVADFNNDGNEDLFLTQNLFAVPRGMSRVDAGRGLLLEGDGTGTLTPISGSESGIKVYGEQRGAAVSDFDRDGRVDLVVSQNGAQMRLFRNRTETSGYRITLVGPPGNQNGVGSSIRLVYASGDMGPKRSVQAGSGYWSQNGVTQVLGATSSVQAIQVTWFDGERQNVLVTEGEKNYTIIHPGIE